LRAAWKAESSSEFCIISARIRGSMALSKAECSMPVLFLLCHICKAGLLILFCIYINKNNFASMSDWVMPFYILDLKLKSVTWVLDSVEAILIK
jgi:hypothetical protein